MSKETKKKVLLQRKKRPTITQLRGIISQLEKDKDLLLKQMPAYSTFASVSTKFPTGGLPVVFCSGCHIRLQGGEALERDSGMRDSGLVLQKKGLWQWIRAWARFKL